MAQKWFISMGGPFFNLLSGVFLGVVFTLGLTLRHLCIVTGGEIWGRPNLSFRNNSLHGGQNRVFLGRDTLRGKPIDREASLASRSQTVHLGGNKAPWQKNRVEPVNCCATVGPTGHFIPDI